MKNSCRLFFAIAVMLVTCTAALAQPSTPPTTQAPSLIVYAKTDLENRGAPTLDLLDLERYFTVALQEKGVQNVAPSQTARQPHPPDPSMYLLELSVNSIQESVRSRRILGDYLDDPIFHVELSLTVKHIASGQVIRTLGETQESHLSPPDVNDLKTKRGVIYTASDHLVDRFVEAASAGGFGDELKLVPRPTWFAGVVAGFQTWHLLAGADALLLMLLVALVWSLRGYSVSAPQPFVDSASKDRPPRRAAWDEELLNAFALHIKTDCFSEEACLAVAAANRESMLANHAEIERKEAERELTVNEREQHYRELAVYSAAKSKLEQDYIIEVLRAADLWEFWVLQTAKTLSSEAVAQ